MGCYGREKKHGLSEKLCRSDSSSSSSSDEEVRRFPGEKNKFHRLQKKKKTSPRTIIPTSMAIPFLLIVFLKTMR